MKLPLHLWLGVQMLVKQAQAKTSAGEQGIGVLYLDVFRPP